MRCIAKETVAERLRHAPVNVESLMLPEVDPRVQEDMQRTGARSYKACYNTVGIAFGKQRGDPIFPNIATRRHTV